MFFGKDKKKRKKPGGLNEGDDFLGMEEGFENKLDTSKDVVSNIDNLLKETENLSSTVTQADLEERRSCGC